MESYKHNMGVFLAKDKVRLFYQSWTAKKQKAVVIVSHGIGEHSGRYGNLMEALENKGISFYAIDHRGHGKSGGLRGHVDKFTNYISDLKQLYDEVIVKENKKNTKIYLLGHSLGGLIANKYALTHPEDINYLILSAPALISAVQVPAIKEKVGKVLSNIMPKLIMSNEIDANDLSTDPDVVKAYIDDPLNHGSVSTRFYTEYLKTAEECLNRIPELKMPLLVIHGTGDRMVNIKSSELVYEHASSTDKKIKTFPGLFHETMNEAVKERKKVLKVLTEWILERL